MRSLAGRKLLFSEADQAIFELDDDAGRLWEQLELGLKPQQIIAGVPEEARGSAGKTLGWLRSVREAEHPAPPRQDRQRVPADPEGLMLELAQVAVQVDLPQALVAPVEAELGHLKSAVDEAQARIVVRNSGDRIHARSNGQERSCSSDEFIPLLKGELLDEVLRTAAYEVALHAAALVGDDRLLLLCGSPGAGKTTLAIALTKSGFEMAADDVLLLDGHGRGVGLPFPFAAKSPSWPLISAFYPDVGRRSHRRPDGQVVSYVLPERRVPQERRPIGFVLFLDRQAGARPRLEDVEPTEALAALISEGSTRDERLSTNGFEALVDALSGARCCTLTYDDLVGAVDALKEFVG